MLKIRLQRTGKRGQAYFRVVILEHTQKPKGKFLELLGSYDPHKKTFEVKMDRIKHWISKGAQVSPTINNLLVNYKYWNRSKVQSWKPKNRKNAEGTEKTETSTMETEKRMEDTGQKTEVLAETSAEQKPAEETKQKEIPVESQLETQ